MRLDKKRKPRLPSLKIGGILILVFVLKVIACAPEAKTSEDSISEKMEVVSKPKKVVSPATSSTASSRDLIDYRDVDIDLQL